MGRRRKRLDDRPCDLCEERVSKLTRVQLDATRSWRLICDECWQERAPDNPHYTYGGVWRAKKRRG